MQRLSIRSSKKKYTNSIDNFLTNVRKVAKKRGASDRIAKRINCCASNVKSQLRKNNAVNPYLAKCLNELGTSIRGVKNVPANVKTQLPRIFKSLRQGVHQDVKLFLGTINKIIRSMSYEAAKWEPRFTKKLQAVKKGTAKYKCDPSLKRQCDALHSALDKFKTKWSKQLNLLVNHAHPQVRAQIRATKKELEKLQCILRKNKSIMNATLKASTSKKLAKKKAQLLLTKADVKAFQKNMQNRKQQIENCRNSMTNFQDQLKCIKVCK